MVIVLSHGHDARDYSTCFEESICENKPYERITNPVMMNIPVVVEDFYDSFRTLMPEISPFLSRFLGRQS